MPTDVVRALLLRRAEAQDVEDLARICVTETVQEALGLRELVRGSLQARRIFLGANIATEDEHLEAYISWQEVLNLDRPSISGTYEDLRRDPRADDQLRREVLILGVHDD